jgi:hypothetical protein
LIQQEYGKADGQGVQRNVSCAHLDRSRFCPVDEGGRLACWTSRPGPVVQATDHRPSSLDHGGGRAQYSELMECYEIDLGHRLAVAGR